MSISTTMAEHPTVAKLIKAGALESSWPPPRRLDSEDLRRICLDLGADDAGFVEIDRAEIADQHEDILAAFPKARTLISFVLRMNRENLRTPPRSLANLEFHHTGHEVDEVGRRIVRALEERGARAINVAMGFPMEMEKFPAKIWVVSHKPVAEAAGLGKMGVHRNVIHPKFGNFILLGTVVTDAEVSKPSQPVDYNPCLECKLCVAACPTGAIGVDGYFDFSACYTHNYREFMGGFSDWAETLVESKSVPAYRRRFSLPETTSMWQSLSFGANYKAAYCLSVCPAGEDVIAPFLADRKRFTDEIVRPVQQKKETVYVIPGSDAEVYVQRRFPHKPAKHVNGSLRPQSIAAFLKSMSLAFQRGQSEGLDAVYHFTFTGAESHKATITIRDRKLSVENGHNGKPDLRVWADSRTWLRFLAKETSIVTALLTLRVRMLGDPRLLLAFGKCFPS